MDSHEVRRQWAERSGAYSPAYYAHHGPDGTSETLRQVLDRYVDRDAAVLELGCSSGRHLAHLLDGGFGNLTGIDVNGDAFDVMEEVYPDLAARGTFYCDAIEDVVGGFADGAFDAIYSVETLQHLHPEAEWVFAELARITGDLLVTVENEGDGEHRDEDDGGDGNDHRSGDAGSETDRSRPAGVNYVDDGLPLYYRDWKGVFTDLGFVEVDARPCDRDTMRVFRATDP